MPRSRSATFLVAVLAAATLLVGVVGARAQQASPIDAIDEAGWQGVLGVRSAVSAAQRYVVLLRAPSLAARVQANGGTASESEMRAWTGEAITLQEQFLARMPDVLANAGGVVVSYFEWVQGLQEYFWREEEVNAKLHDIVARAFEEAWYTHENRELSLRIASYGIAVQRVAEATTTRGLYP